MLSRIGAGVDRAVAALARRVATSRMRPDAIPEDARARLEQVRAFYADPALVNEPNRFFVPPEERAIPRELKSVRYRDGERVDLAYPSTYVPRYEPYRDRYLSHEQNRTAHVRLYRHRTAGSPAVVCVHGWAGGSYPLEARVFPVHYFFRLGFDVALFTLPFHGQRKPAEGISGALFPSGNVARTNEGFGQAIHDLRALRAAMLGYGAPSVSLVGLSLGGYTTALAVTLDADWAAAVCLITPVDLAELMWNAGSRSVARRTAEARGIGIEDMRACFRLHSPLARTPRIPADRRLIASARGDRIVPASHTERLERHWSGVPAIRFSGGHLLQFGRSRAFRAIGALLRTVREGPGDRSTS